MEQPFVMRELLERGEFQGFKSRRKPPGAAIALDIKREFKFPGDDDAKPEEHDK